MAERSLDAQALDLLDEAMEVAPAARRNWIGVQDAPGAVRARAQALLDAHTQAAALMPTGGAPARADATPPPERIGAYRITGLVGEGGMGAVYRAERAAGDFDHAVAIKVIRPGVLSEPLVERFQRERQTLARLAHRNIARLFDGGETEAGQPYIVMELVEGAPLGDWIARAPSQAIRVRLFLQVCAAVSFAHQNLIVHRDITPANVLVEADGTPKLIDFGIARPMTSGEDGEVGPGPGLSLTPGFAAPERMAGEAATTLSDVYSLGRVLETLFPTPRPADLEAVVRRATAERPEARYSTVDALADDLAAWRDGRPVAARGGGRWYVFRRFVSRHRGPVAASAAGLALLVAAFAVASWSYVRAEAARRVEAERFAQVRSLARYMIFDLNDRLAQVAGNTAARASIAGEAQRYLDRLVATPAASEALKLETARGLIRLARVQGVPSEPNLGEVAQAARNLDAADRILSGLPSGPTRDIERAMVQVYRGLMLLRAQGRQAEAAPLILAADAAVEAIPAAARGDRWIEARRVTRKARLEMADVANRREDIPALADAMVADMAAWPAERRASPARELDEVFIAYYRALFAATKDPKAALAEHLAAERRFDALLAKRPNDPTLLWLATWNVYDGFAAASQAGEEEVSHRLIEKARDSIDRLRAVDDRDRAAAILASNIREGLAQDLRDRDRFDEAVALEREVVAGRRASAALDPNGRTVGSLGFSLAIQGIIAKNAGQRPLACASWREAQAVLEDLEAKGTITGFHKSFLPGLARANAACAGGTALAKIPALR